MKIVFPKYVVSFFCFVNKTSDSPKYVALFVCLENNNLGIPQVSCLICLSWSSPTSSLSWSPPGSRRSCSSTTYCLRSSWKRPTVFTTSTSSTTSEQSFGIPSLQLDFSFNVIQVYNSNATTTGWFFKLPPIPTLVQVNQSCCYIKLFIKESFSWAYWPFFILVLNGGGE